MTETDLWMDRSRAEHPLAKYGAVIPPASLRPSTKMLVRRSPATAHGDASFFDPGPVPSQAVCRACLSRLRWL